MFASRFSDFQWILCFQIDETKWYGYGYMILKQSKNRTQLVFLQFFVEFVRYILHYAEHTLPKWCTFASRFNSTKFWYISFSIHTAFYCGFSRKMISIFFCLNGFVSSRIASWNEREREREFMYREWREFFRNIMSFTFNLSSICLKYSFANLDTHTRAQIVSPIVQAHITYKA